MKIKNRCFPFGIPEGNEPLLFCFHHAGGNAGQIRAWAGIHEGIAIVPVEYAGHGCRIGEDFSESIEQIAAELSAQIANESKDRDIYIFGHSIGSLIAFETVKLLEESGKEVKRLIVAGRGAPFDKDFGTFRSTMGRQALIEEMLRVGGMEIELLENESFMEYFSPIVLSDYRLHELYVYGGSHIAAPVSAHCSLGDADTSPEQMSHWEQVSGTPFRERTFEGSHFFVLEMEDYLDILLSEIKQI